VAVGVLTERAIPPLLIGDGAASTSREVVVKRVARVAIFALAAVPALAAVSAPRFFASDLATQLAASVDGDFTRTTHILMQALTKGPLLVLVASALALLPLRSVAGSKPLLVAAAVLTVGPVLSMFLSANRGISPAHLELVLAATLAATLARLRPEWLATQIYRALRLYAYGSLAAAALFPSWALQGDYKQALLPGLHSRLYGIAPHANVLGALLATMLILVPLVRPRPRFFVLELGLVAALLLWTQSKTSLLGVGFAVVVFTVHRLLRSAVARAVVVAYAGTATVLALYVSGALGQLAGLLNAVAHPDSAQHGALTGRPAIWAATVDVWKPHKLFGYGLDLWGLKMRLAEIPRIGLPSPSAHSQLYQSLGESGLVGLTTVSIYVVILIACAFRSEGITKGVLIALVGATVLRAFTEVPFKTYAYDPYFFCQFALILLAMSGSSAALRRRDEHVSGPEVLRRDLRAGAP
jgi:O-antigen ligase